jgi:hypothetical protein
VIAGGREGAPARLLSVLTVVAAVAAAATTLWLVPASLHIVSWPRSGPHRVAVFAPLGPLWMCAGAGVMATLSIAASVRRRPGAIQRVAHVVAPLNLLWLWTVPYWPVIPDRLPLLVVLAGPLRWGFAVLALGGVLMRAVPLPSLVNRPLPGRRAVFGLSLALYVALAVLSLRTLGISGDEPHYLMIAHSLLADGDLKIENNHARGDYRAFFNGDLHPEYLHRGVNGEIYSIHAPGLPAMLLPGYAVAGVLGAVLTMCALAALAAVAVFDLAQLMSTRAIAWLTWALVCVTVPFVPHAWELYPEMACCAIVAWAFLWAMTDPPDRVVPWLWRGACLAWLPWLHTKFTVFLAGLALMVVWRLRARWRLAVAFLTPIALSGFAWLAFFYVIYGTLDPQAPYASYTAQYVRIENLPRSLFGLLLDQKFGLLVYTPVYALVVPGLSGIGRQSKSRGMAAAGLLLAFGYTLSSGRLYMWWGGSSAPARFMVPVLPLLVPALAAGLYRLRGTAAAAIWGTCAAISLAVGLSGALLPGRLLLFSPPHGLARILEQVQGSAPLAGAIPTFTQEDWLTPAVGLTPWLVAALAGVGGAWLCARRTGSALWSAAGELAAFGVTAAVLVSSFAPDLRADSRTRGSLDLLTRFDPIRARAFDYATFRRLTPQAWLDASPVVFEREPGTDPDPLGRLTGPLRLPQGDYEARVWFDGERGQPGAFQVAIGNGYTIARADGPLSNPVRLGFQMPVPIPAVWMQLTDTASARAVRRLEIAPSIVVMAAQRPLLDVRAAEGLDGRVGAYVAYLDGSTYPERGMFWTVGRQAGRLLIAPAGATALRMTVHAGPRPNVVLVKVADHEERLSLAAEETRTVRVALPNMPAVAVEVRASASFRPSDVDPTSSDRRELGCQVRLVLE